MKKQRTIDAAIGILSSIALLMALCEPLVELLEPSALKKASAEKESVVKEMDVSTLQEALSAEHLLDGFRSVYYQTSMDDGMRVETAECYGMQEDDCWFFWKSDNYGGCSFLRSSADGGVIYEYDNSYMVAAYVEPEEVFSAGMNSYSVLSKVEGEITDCKDEYSVLYVTTHFEEKDGATIDTTYELDDGMLTLRKAEKIYKDAEGNTAGTFVVNVISLDSPLEADSTAEEKVTEGELCHVNFYVEHNGTQNEYHYDCSQGTHIFVSTSGHCAYYNDAEHTEPVDEPESRSSEVTYYAVITDAE